MSRRLMKRFLRQRRSVTGKNLRFLDLRSPFNHSRALRQWLQENDQAGERYVMVESNTTGWNVVAVERKGKR